ncbi:penicillin-insensitive murein endopeptidase [[Haemophilus] ducreyi]|uniref:Penicillin-insensitive murein endopeptidase A n=2 Tax=Haemophilus ducreyi TaxID=730 RepID=Q7VLX1_HAEDU|nr:penicillin-insensitive murein endopeptidase [[Haemophilus] ducreyi]AAP96099.1 penicillin-insensitive murein endopeptidase A [[Haemophilus] ducreyi 35000HP]AKO31080.1 murein endopeptidase [[Haemophilus] ducreyi]AKO32524.1 murein endopeptidase [[Haemophilus] ducreyi]AKO33975.1 murein endopeptidase [[Haemophilus] ducreyi]AKO35422.1 murein endopeptidase [[Haemophilus] ducreyi]
MNVLKSLLLFSFTLSSLVSQATLWEKIRQPVAGQPQSIGGYSNGCIIGARPLALKGNGYQVIRSIKNRYYGHPQLLSYLTDLAKRTRTAGLPPILIGDMGMPAGGRFASGHASHQTGLDADIWLRFGPMDDKTARNPAGLATIMVNRTLQRVDEKRWTNQHTTLIRLAAQDQRVNRIFVNPAIKLKLCQTAGKNRAWLQKIRPWYAHDSHFHVRLSCPSDARNCENQPPIAAGDGCGDELHSWFLPAPANTTAAKPKVIPMVPVQCQMILSSQGLN